MSPTKMETAMREMQDEAYERFMANERLRAKILGQNAPRAVALATTALKAIQALRRIEKSMQAHPLAPTFCDHEGPNLDDAVQALDAVLHNAQSAC